MSRFIAVLQDPRVVVALPVFFLVGYALNDHLVTSAEARVVEAERAAKRLGAWSPPPLTPAERSALMAERAECVREIGVLQARLERA